MNRIHKYVSAVLICLTAISVLLLTSFLGNNAVTVFTESRPVQNRKTIIIDAGHGGVDGGATSCTGVLESNINLEIALRLNDLLHLLGMKTTMIRTTDCSIYTEGQSIAAKKVSDLKERVRIVNETKDAVLISLHQNYFSSSKYNGAQTFYASTAGSKELAYELQTRIAETLTPENKRTPKKATGIYLMEHIQKCGILLECGFISNPQETAKLMSEEYQKQLCCVIASTISMFLTTEC